MLKNVINLGEMPSCESDLETAYNTIDAATPVNEPIGFGRALLSGKEKNTVNPFSSVIILRSGSLTVQTPDGISVSLQKDEVANLPAGQLTWSAEDADCVILLLREDNPQLTLSKLDLEHPMLPGGAPNAALLTTAAPQTSRYEFYDTDALSWGIWATTPYARRPITYSFAEVMMLRKGEVTFSNPDEGNATFKAGDIFMIKPGAVASWDNTIDLEKFWLIRSTD